MDMDILLRQPIYRLLLKQFFHLMLIKQVLFKIIKPLLCLIASELITPQISTLPNSFAYKLVFLNKLFLNFYFIILKKHFNSKI